jgi:hypothetical protein
MKKIKSCDECCCKGEAVIINRKLIAKPFCKRLSDLHVNPPRKKYIDDVDSILKDCPLEDV